MRLALAQIDTVVGDLDGNRERIVSRLEEARGAGADLVLFPELAVTGYPPEDLLLKPGFLRAARRSLEAIARRDDRDLGARRVPSPRSRSLQRLRRAGGRRGAGRSTASASCRTTASSTRTATSSPAAISSSLRLGDTLIGLTVCEDIWQPGPPATDLALAGAHVICNISASPFHLGKGQGARGDAERPRPGQRVLGRLRECRRRSGRARVRRPLARPRPGRRRSSPAGPRSRRRSSSSTSTRPPPSAHRLRDARRRALARGTPRAADPPRSSSSSAAPEAVRRSRPPGARPASPRRSTSSRRCGARSSSVSPSYVEKNGFREVVLGISGGIDSALTAALAPRRWGPTAWCCVSMPSRFSSDDTRGDARRVAERLGTRYSTRCPSSRWSARSTARSPTRSTARSRGWPRRTSRPGCAARS